jgi:predicted acylesterase/phospholipase RssA
MDAIIFGGGVAKGAFAAGAMSVLAKAGLRVRRIVGTSSGALNAAYLASAVRSGTEAAAGDELVRIWLEEGTLTHGFNLSLRGIVDFEGVSTSATLLSLLRRHIRPSTARHPVDVRIVTTNSAGERGTLEPGRQGTTFEHVLRYEGATFDSEVSLESLFDGVAASAAFPGAFVPFPLEIGGKQVPCFDGGLTDNTSVKQAIDGAPDVDRVFVIVPYPTLLEPAPERRGLALAAHLVEILTEERLYRDLREAYAVNATLARLEVEFPEPSARAAVLRAFGWSDRRRLEIVEIRPSAPLEGGPFDGFLSRRLRENYVAKGQDAARAWLAAREEG